MLCRQRRRTGVDEALPVRRDVCLGGDRLLELEHGLICGDGDLELELAGPCAQGSVGGRKRGSGGRTFDVNLDLGGLLVGHGGGGGRRDGCLALLLRGVRSALP